ncbi:CRISPR-associated Cas5d family protein [Aquabacterium commune]|uniref:pre-crRNA processing endonuclease n=1 Tax=Aquabacterium commune TaxID=70586 RepID=A0A4R6RDC4_9BURK|nr:type I-C CRISPR-associated protein Cas5c [Aquabacterium commune]TDP83717.1 CRISPR-associated Cas5d family protein [Aquabacterium commune]
MRRFCLEVTGDYACFTRPEMKVERVSYDLITPSAARAVFDAILWKPAIRWRIRKIEVLKPVRWISVRRNEVSSVVSNRNALAAMNEGHGQLALYIEEDRQQRAGLFLRDVAYRLYAEMEFLTDESRGNPAKYTAMFTRRAAAGQCVNQPYLGCREFAASFRPVPVLETGRGAYGVADTEPAALQEMSADLGWMLYDLDYADRADPKPQFFRARVERGVMDLAGVEVRG